MKQCPACNRTYADDSITFCLADGSLLSAPYEPDATQRIHARPTNPPVTEVLTAQPQPFHAVPSMPLAAPPARRNNNLALMAVIGAVLALLIGGGIFAWLKSGPPAPTSNSAAPPANTNTKPVETKAKTDYLRSPWLGLEVWQGGKVDGMFKADDLRRTRVAMTPEPFEIRVPRLKDNPPVLVVAWTDSSIFSQIKQGDKLDTESESYFNPYKSMADTSYGSASLMLNNDAHYVYDEDRLKPVSESQSTIFISSIFQTDEERSIKEQKSDLYLVVFRDLNQNETADNGEFEFLILDF